MSDELMRGRGKPHIFAVLLALFVSFLTITDAAAEGQPAGGTPVIIRTDALTGQPAYQRGRGIPTEVHVGESEIITLPYQIKRYSVTVQEWIGEKDDSAITKPDVKIQEPRGPALVQVISVTPAASKWGFLDNMDDNQRNRFSDAILAFRQVSGPSALGNGIEKAVADYRATGRSGPLAAAFSGNSVCSKFCEPEFLAPLGIRRSDGKTEMKVDGQYVGKATLIVWDQNEKKEFIDITVVPNTPDLALVIAGILSGDGPEDNISIEKQDGRYIAIRNTKENERVVIRTLNNAVILTGNVSSEDKKARIDSVLKSFGRDVKSRDLVYLQGGITKEVDNTGSANDKNIKVVNLLEVSDPKQILLSVTVASIDRNATRELGINWAYAGRNITIDTAVSAVSPGLTTINQLVSGSKYGTLTTEGISGANLGIIHGPSGTQYLLKALAQKGLAKVLAEPNLLVRNGETGRFLAGGEFPIPVVQSQNTTQGGTSITVVFKEFGVKLNLTPVVKENGNIELRMGNNGKDGCIGVGEEDCQGVIISSLDFANAVTLSGFRIPALKKDYVNTDVELKEGETFVLAGIINEEWSKELAKVPFLGDIPILGAFFRDQKLNKSERELVFFVTPKLVKPMPPGQAPDIPGANEPTPRQENMLKFIPGLPDSMTIDPEKLR